MDSNAPALRELRKLTDLAEFAPEYIRFMRAVPENAVCETLWTTRTTTSAMSARPSGRCDRLRSWWWTGCICMPLDRFHLMMTLFMSAGISVVTPYTVSEGPLSLDVVRRQIDIELLAGRHIAYIEMDATVNYLSSIMDKARATDSLAFFRNRAPDDRYVEHIPSRGVPSDGV
jgi:hypothetical protein